MQFGSLSQVLIMVCTVCGNHHMVEVWKTRFSGGAFFVVLSTIRTDTSKLVFLYPLYTPLFSMLTHVSSNLSVVWHSSGSFNPLNAELNPICPLLALFRAYHILHVSR